MSDSLENWNQDQQYNEILKRYCRKTRKNPDKFPGAAEICSNYWEKKNRLKKKRNPLSYDPSWYGILIIILLIILIGIIKSVICRS